MVEDTRLRYTSVSCALAQALMQGDDSDTNAFLGWQNLGGESRTAVTPGPASALGVLLSLKQTDDECQTGQLGNRASAYVTTALGRRNCEAAAEAVGSALEYRTCHTLPNPVPTTVDGLF